MPVADDCIVMMDICSGCSDTCFAVTHDCRDHQLFERIRRIPVCVRAKSNVFVSWRRKAHGPIRRRFRKRAREKTPLEYLPPSVNPPVPSRIGSQQTDVRSLKKYIC